MANLESDDEANRSTGRSKGKKQVAQAAPIPIQDKEMMEKAKRSAQAAPISPKPESRNFMAHSVESEIAERKDTRSGAEEQMAESAAVLDSLAAGSDIRDAALSVTPAAKAPIPPRAIELVTARYRAVLSETGDLSLSAGEYECAVTSIAQQGDPAAFSKRDDPGEVIRRLFEMAASRDATLRMQMADGDAPDSSGMEADAAAPVPVPHGEPAKSLVIKANVGASFYRVVSSGGRGAGAADLDARIASGIERLLRQRYRPLMESRCGPPPESLFAAED